MLRRRRLIGRLALVALLSPAASAAQAIDEGSLSIRLDGREIGREEFVISSGRGPDGRSAGTTIASTARYPALDADAEIRGVLERNPAGVVTVFQLEFDGERVSERYLGGQDRRRITVHRFQGTAQAAREYPGGPRAVVLVDSLYAFLTAVADLATPEGGPVSAISPRNNMLSNFTATSLPGPDGTLVQLSGDLVATVVLDALGRLTRIEIPAEGIVVQRVDD